PLRLLPLRQRRSSPPGAPPGDPGRTRRGGAGPGADLLARRPRLGYPRPRLPMIALSTVLRRHASVRFRIVDGEAVVLHQRSAEVMVLNPVAARILALADGVAPIASWVEVLGREYDVAADVLERDLLEFAAELVDEGLLETVPPEGEGR